MEENKLELGNFTGTMDHYEGYLGTTWTDGIVYLAKNGCSWVCTDICSIVKTVEKVKKEPFIAIKLVKKKKDQAVCIYTDGNDNELFKQEYKYTDIWNKTDKEEIIFYFSNNTLMLSSEY